jgi:hypothetical protein
MLRAQSSNSILRSTSAAHSQLQKPYNGNSVNFSDTPATVGSTLNGLINAVGGVAMGGGSPSGKSTGVKTRARSSSLVTVTEVGGDDGDQVVDRLGVGVNENANWVNAPGESSLDFVP